MNIKTSIDKTAETIQKEINRFTERNNGSIFKEAENLMKYGILAKENSKKKTAVIPDEFLNTNNSELIGEINE